MTIDLNEADATHLRNQASIKGESLEAVASNLLRGQMTFLADADEELASIPRVIDEQGVFHQDRQERLEAYVRRRFGKLPTILAEALTREALYQDHD
jgi:hypothetical protein